MIMGDLDRIKINDLGDESARKCQFSIGRRRAIALSGLV